MIKNHLFRTLAIFAISAGIFVTNISFVAGCKSDDVYDATLKKMDGFNLIKDYRVYLKPDKANPKKKVSTSFPVTLNSGINYKFFLGQNTSYEGELILSLYSINSDKKQDVLIATNYIKSMDKAYPSVEFKSATTINCMLELSFKHNKEGCGVAIAGMKK
jgi:hypothetical protein